ncbi:uncharacterized protein LOC123536339 [Mercenaria mercenaria]|uniref:uncharacterized protein LOC123536339 n=1 Tax=Mercenaria mercenaria TaxID=6596 RepID=UPI00234E98EF|nr:uncharacterized protein LOC123536339 [Mercenaria mercenaria]
MLLGVLCFIFVFGGFQAADAMDTKIEPVVRELQSLENRFFDFNMHIEKKLAQMEKAFDEKLNSVETFYKRKLSTIEERLSESENRQTSTEIFYKNKLAEVKNRCYNIEEKLHSTQKLNDIIFNRMEKRLNSIEEKLDEAVYTYENKVNKLEKTLYNKDKKHNSDVKSADKKFSKIEKRQYETDGRKINANAENTELKYNNGIPNSRGIQKGNLTTPEIAGHATDESETSALEVKDKKSENTECASLTRRLTSSGNNRIAFTAYLSNYASELGREHTIPFDQVLLNEGQAFDTVFHAFICPVNGIYMFQSAAMSMYHEMIQTEIVKDGVALVIMYASGSTGGHGYDQGFNSAIIQCNQSERVWVRVHSHDGTAIYGYLKYTTFSGYLLWEI